MSYKDIIVHQTDGAGSARSLDAAIKLARDNDAHLTGVYVLNYPAVPTFVQAEVPTELIQQGYQTLREAAHQCKKAFEAKCEREGVRDSVYREHERRRNVARNGRPPVPRPL